jgi:hypothetical protein
MRAKPELTRRISLSSTLNSDIIYWFPRVTSEIKYLKYGFSTCLASILLINFIVERGVEW